MLAGDIDLGSIVSSPFHEEGAQCRPRWGLQSVSKSCSWPEWAWSIEASNSQPSLSVHAISLWRRSVDSICTMRFWFACIIFWQWLEHCLQLQRSQLFYPHSSHWMCFTSFQYWMQAFCTCQSINIHFYTKFWQADKGSNALANIQKERLDWLLLWRQPATQTVDQKVKVKAIPASSYCPNQLFHACITGMHNAVSKVGKGEVCFIILESYKGYWTLLLCSVLHVYAVLLHDDAFSSWIIFRILLFFTAEGQ